MELQVKFRLDVIFLCVSHLNKAKAVKLRRKLGMDQLVVFESDGASGGLILFWKALVVVQPMEVRATYIDVVVCNTHDDPWRLNFYRCLS